MSRIKTFQDLFKRYRRPGDLFIAMLSFLFAIFLLVNLPFQTRWVDGTRLFAQPAFWPAVAVFAMVLFSSMHMIGALVSERIPGRFQEVLHWVRSVEYALWFMAYVALVPVLGYLLATLVFTVTLSYRLGYRSWRWMAAALVFGFVVVVVFRGFLQVKLPAGALYELLPPGGLRSVMMTYF